MERRIGAAVIMRRGGMIVGALRILVYRLVGRVRGMNPLLWEWMGRLRIVSSPVIVLRFWGVLGGDGGEVGDGC